MTNAITAAQSLMTSATVADQAGDAEMARTDIASNSKKREQLNKKMHKLELDAIHLEPEANRLARKAAKAKCFRGIKEKKAGKAQAKVDRRNAAAKEVGVEVKKHRKQAEQAIDRLQSAMEEMNSIVADQRDDILASYK